MKAFLRRLLKIAAYTAAGVVIALAIAVGLFRLFLPRLPEYQEEIKGWASTAIGLEVEFSGMDARWGLSGPELEFYNTELVQSSTQARVIAAEEVRIGVGLMRLLVDRKLVVDRVVVSGSSVEVRQREDGRWRVQGSPLDGLFGPREAAAQDLPDIEVIGEDIEVIFLQPGDERPRFFDVPRAIVSADSNRLAIDANIRLPDDLGRLLELSATQLLSLPEEQRHWDITLDADDLNLAGWSDIRNAEDWRVRSGIGDLELSLAYANGHVRNASAEVDFSDVALQEGELFDVSGRFELNVADNGWLVAAEEFQIETAEHVWPEASFRAEAITDTERQVVILDVRSTYLYLDDTRLFSSWLSASQQETLAELQPTGIVRELVATVSNIGTDSPGFDIAADLERTGLAASGKWPGLRGFSGELRANGSGGRLEISSSDMVVEFGQYLPEPINIDSAEGTVIWRSGGERTTILSDSIQIRSDVFNSQSNVQLTIEHDGSSPVLDFASRWSVNDLSEIKRYVPQNIVKPKLFDWLQSAFQQGSIPRGTTVLNGPLDKFPFDNDEGRFLIEASLRNLIFKYHPAWPASDQSEMEATLDGTHLYSERNRSMNFGNRTVDAKIEIADVRKPVLTIDAFSTGTLETIRSFTSQSPIAEVFGGQLERITVSGDAAFGLELTVPLADAKNFDFTARLRSNNGTLSIERFAPVVTDLIGEVTISRNNISSQSLGGTFLGEAVTIDLAMSDDPRFRVVASTSGLATAEAIVTELGMPLEGLITGATEYQSRILFPSANQDVATPFTIQIDSDLEGLGVTLPEPVGKPENSTLQIRGDIRLIDGGDIIESAGFAEDLLAWQVAFNQEEGFRDLDRGVVTMGGDVLQPADTRGLHIRGATSTVRLDDWLSLSRSGDEKSGVAERIRSIDLHVENLFAVGQHLQGHHVRVDRSARDWLVQIEGEDVVGSVFVPYDFASERAMVVEMERLHLPGDEVTPEDTSILDPRTLPPITLTATDFSLGNRHLGSVDVQLNRIPEGLQADRIATRDDTFEIVGTGRWVADTSEPQGSRTYAAATLTSTDVMQTMARLDFEPGIVSDEMSVAFDLSFSGGPRADFLDVLDGDVNVQLGAGQLEEVEPGAGRMFGLMSVVALPRRLSLDFRDVFSKGFGFDKIAGTFRIVDGMSYTCDLSLEGPAADIGIVGRTGLAARDYEQTAVVSANVGNTLPIVGAVVAGPQAAAALLIFSQIFKKPLQEVGQVYYGIGGSWDEPVIDSTDSKRFAAHSELAGCLTVTE